MTVNQTETNLRMMGSCSGGGRRTNELSVMGLGLGGWKGGAAICGNGEESRLGG